ncbi:MAG: hypothetical protein JWM19_4935 [Actinomycetia bacterium]|nr:hypothetical protein [Actinomycetes bacterium]
MPDGAGRRSWWRRPVRIAKGTQQEADRRAGKSLVSLLDQVGKAEVEALLARGEFIPAVRRVRELTGMRLIDAKRTVESLQHLQLRREGAVSARADEGAGLDGIKHPGRGPVPTWVARGPGGSPNGAEIHQAVRYCFC